MEYISGVVDRITYSNEETGFSVIKIKSGGFSDLVTVVGNLAAVNVGSVLRLKGEWKYDSKYGKQFSTLDYRETVPATIAGIEKYLGSGLIKGIGPVFARKIVKHFKENTLTVIEELADDLIQVDSSDSIKIHTSEAVPVLFMF
jgi:exodeoxyribonuclease V alpha subunit